MPRCERQLCWSLRVYGAVATINALRFAGCHRSHALACMGLRIALFALLASACIAFLVVLGVAVPTIATTEWSTFGFDLALVLTLVLLVESKVRPAERKALRKLGSGAQCKFLRVPGLALLATWMSVLAQRTAQRADIPLPLRIPDINLSPRVLPVPIAR